MVTLQELYNALNTIKGACEDSACSTCPMRINDGCFFQMDRLPENWDIKEPPQQVFKFFK